MTVKANSATDISPRPRRWVSRRLRDPRTLWLAALVMVVMYLVAVPVATVLWGSFQTTPPGVAGPLTLENYIEGYQSRRFVRAISNSLIFASSSSVVAFVLGTYLAWLTERTNAPFRNLIYALVLVPVVVPGILTSIAWVLVLNDTIGIANHALGSIGIGPIFDAYTMPAMIWADAMDSITLPFLLMAAAFRAMDPTLEEASTTSGASHAYTIRHITLPLMTPAILATFLIVFVKTIDNFGVPAVMGIPGGINVFATEVWLATSRSPVNHNRAAALAVGYVIVTLAALLLYYKATRLSEKFTTITGKGFRPTRMRLGRRRYVHGLSALMILAVAVAVPLGVMLYASLLPYYTPPSLAAFSNMSLGNYESVLESPLVYRALKNNLIAALAASTAAMLLAALISWVVIRTQIRGRKLLDALAFAPIALPGVVIALALMWFYLTVPVPIYASLWIISLGYLTAYLPYGLRATHASLTQVGKELEEASAACGATFRRTFFKITLPLITSGLLVGFIYVFSRAFKGLSLPIILAGPGNEVLPVLVYDMYESGQYTELNALGLLMFVFLLVLAALAQRLSKRVGYIEVS